MGVSTKRALGATVAFCVALLAGGPAFAADGTAKPGAATPRRLADMYAEWAMREGGAPGVGVAVILPGAEPRLFTYGDAVRKADGVRRRPFTRRSLFEIGSVTKVFTTNLLGQQVAGGGLDLDQPLSAYKAVLGTLPAKARQVTLRELADFTGGWPDYPPRCAAGKEPGESGCLPSARPTVSAYGAQDFAAFFRTTAPFDYNSGQPATALPAPYHYSDASLGLLGLLLGAPAGKPITDQALGNWFAAVEGGILTPLGMADTKLYLPRGAAQRVAMGYAVALATPVVTGGSLAGVDVVSRGGGYAGPPTVTISGGGGSGAGAAAVVANGVVQAINVTSGGSGYIAPASVRFQATVSEPAPAAKAAPASASLVVSGGKVVAAVVTEGGSGYTKAPTVVVSGGRRGAGRDAVLTAQIADGAVVHLTVVDGGAGYVAPLSVTVAPGAGLQAAVPIWAPAGALHASLADMATFAAAALGRPKIGDRPVPAPVRKGFAVAMAPSACTGPNPALGACPPGMALSALAWAINPADPGTGVPMVVSKGGALPGFATAVFLMPESDLGVVVFANSQENKVGGTATTIAGHVARGVLYGLYYGCLLGGTDCR